MNPVASIVFPQTYRKIIFVDKLQHFLPTPFRLCSIGSFFLTSGLSSLFEDDMFTCVCTLD